MRRLPQAVQSLRLFLQVFKEGGPDPSNTRSEGRI